MLWWPGQGAGGYVPSPQRSPSGPSKHSPWRLPGERLRAPLPIAGDAHAEGCSSSRSFPLHRGFSGQGSPGCCSRAQVALGDGTAHVWAARSLQETEAEWGEMAGCKGAGGSLLYHYLQSKIHLGETRTQTSAIFSPVFPQYEDSTSEKIAWSSFSCVHDGWRGRERAD